MTNDDKVLMIPILDGMRKGAEYEVKQLLAANGMDVDAVEVKQLLDKIQGIKDQLEKLKGA